ncbi:MAG: sodium:alanine symporter family protein [Bacteroidales bacterium]|jgi:AGCS family alanine or glycine:cation symporter|nr:sodium:alanine symporter family protein [Bacteroidales bacterium]MCK9498082.1 sodium:alanine symporter family protein [Bacteroidales bacterium]MDY0313572.1 sodium:alanine symporter family protein [Bacteroidales bacterium]NLB86954.1 sodium:alanine symporter family protein [Bacteroidales bacterium]NLB87033.1 sodium:alanine symporter family protein [Bacteroidales bacterium]
MDFLNTILKAYNEYIGGYAILLILIPTGLFFTFYLKFLQVSKFGHALKIVSGKYSTKKTKGDVSSFKALTTALSATVGTGNIVGVALAIHWGGPGAIFWIWVVGFLGMMIKLVECTLALKYRITNADGSVSGGPMYYMEYGLKDKLGKYSKYFAVIFAFAAVLCSFGTGNLAQANSIADSMQSSYNIPEYITGIIIALLVLLIIVGGLKRIAEVTVRLVPIMAVFYFLSAIIVLVVFYKSIPDAFSMILKDAFTGTAATGGFLGSSFILTITMGVKRGLFSNEAGQGSAPMAHAAAKTEHPMQEGLVASLEPLVDTIIICTLTALVIVVTGAWTSNDTQGVNMTILGFERGFDHIGLSWLAKHIISIGLFLFAFSTIIAWAYYGSRAIQYLWGDKAIKPYYYIFSIFVFLGCIWGIDLVWNFVDTVISFMTIPNLIAILLLAPVMKKEVKSYFEYIKTIKK